MENQEKPNYQKYIWYILNSSRRQTEGDGFSTEVMEVESGVIFRSSEYRVGAHGRCLSQSMVHVPFETLENVFKNKIAVKF